MRRTQFKILIDKQDRALLAACARREKLTKSEVTRRAIRAYATDETGCPGCEDDDAPRRPRAKDVHADARSSLSIRSRSR